MNPTLLLIAPLIGWLAGATANWAADILPGWSSLNPEQRLPRTVTALGHYATLPWYFRRHGACPHCGQTRTWRAPAVEIAMIVSYLLLALRFGGSAEELVVSWLYAWFLICVLVIDLETRRVLNVMLLPAAFVALGISLALGLPPIGSALIGGLVAFVLFGLLFVIGRTLFGSGALGMGDVKLVAVIGLMVGYPDILHALVVGALAGAGAAIYLLATRRATLKSTSAYAPYLAVGALSALWNVWGK